MADALPQTLPDAAPETTLDAATAGRIDMSAEALARHSRALDGASPAEILAFALETYAPRVAISTAFGVEGCALIHMAIQIDPNIRVFTVDTDYLFEETRALTRRFFDRYGVQLTVFRPELSVQAQEQRHGLRLYQSDPDRCCALRKVEPTRRALSGLDCWIAGLRRDQGPTRQAIQILERYTQDDGRPLVKVHPLAAWTRSDTWRYVLDHDVPYNPLLDHGYKSLGCWPCTKPVDDDDDERAGRWGGRKAECGIHTFMERQSPDDPSP